MNTKAYRECLQSMNQLTRNQRKAGLGQLNVKESKKTKLTNWSKSPFTVARVARVNDWGGGADNLVYNGFAVEIAGNALTL